MNKERLLRTAALLRAAPRKGFHMDDWKCGTTCCAVGLAAQDPWHMQEGLSLVDCYPSFGSCNGWNAVMGFYEVDAISAHYLFSADEYLNPANPGLVADRIEAFLANGS